MRKLLPIVALLSACGTEQDVAPDCGRTEPSAIQTDWRRGLTTRLTLAAGDPDHSAQDVITEPGQAFSLEGKFAYGSISKDLEGEEVVAFVRTEACAPWAMVGEAITDGDGRASIRVGGLLPSPGRYDFRMIVRGDSSVAAGHVFVVEEDAPAVVFDIDGTLTEDDLELVDGIVIHTVRTTPEALFELDGTFTKEQYLFALEQVLDEDAKAYENAAEVVHHWADQGYQIVYLTGRPYLYDRLTRTWLEDHGLPSGPLFLAQDVADVFPTERGVQSYKRARIERLEAHVDLRAAYGNATTDICAYALAGIPPRDTFIIGAHAGEACDGFDAPNPVRDYASHLATLDGIASR